MGNQLVTEIAKMDLVQREKLKKYPNLGRKTLEELFRVLGEPEENFPIVAQQFRKPSLDRGGAIEQRELGVDVEVDEVGVHQAATASWAGSPPTQTRRTRLAPSR